MIVSLEWDLARSHVADISIFLFLVVCLLAYFLFFFYLNGEIKMYIFRPGYKIKRSTSARDFLKS